MTPSQKIIENIQKKIEFHKSLSKFDHKRIFGRARFIFRQGNCNWSEALTQSWDEARKSVYQNRKEIEIHTIRLAKRFHVNISPVFAMNEMNKAMMAASRMGNNLNQFKQ